MKRPVQVSSGAGGQELSLELDNSGTGGQEAALVSSQTLTRPEGVEPGQENISYNLYIYDKKKWLPKPCNHRKQLDNAMKKILSEDIDDMEASKTSTWKQFHK